MAIEIYLDTSVWGALVDEDPGRIVATRAILEAAREGRLRLFTSRLVLREIARAPDTVRKVLEAVVADASPRRLGIDRETIALAGEYLAIGAFPPASLADAVHIAVASLAAVDAVVSWNFKHMVNLGRRRLVHSVNLRLGHRLIDVVSPPELEVAE